MALLDLYHHTIAIFASYSFCCKLLSGQYSMNVQL